MASPPAAFAGWFVRMTELSFSLVCARVFVNRRHLIWLALGVWLGGVAAGDAPSYRIFVSSESGDIVSQLTWDGVALKTVKVVPVGIMPADIDGPHNVTVAPDGKYWYVTIAHGTPYGTLWKMAVDGDTVVGKAPVEMFPTTISLTPDGELAFVANSDFHGDHPRMNVVSIVYTPQMVTLTNLPACDMPHGVKVNHAGTKVYVTCMNSDEVLEIDRASLAIARRHKTGEGMLPQAMPMKMGHGGAQGGLRRAVLHDACMPTTKPFPHGVAYAPDSRYAFISQESKGVDPGAVNVIDLQTKTNVASVAVPLQPTGITILRRS